MSLSTNIRGALQVRALTAAGFPGAGLVAFEGITFSVPPALAGVKYARLTLIPALGRPFDVGNGTKRHSGIFQVSLFFAKAGDPGSGPVEILADAVKAVFPPGAALYQGGEKVRIKYSERAQVAGDEPDWLHVPTTVGWECFSSSN